MNKHPLKIDVKKPQCLRVAHSYVPYDVHSPAIKAITMPLTNFLLICAVITFDEDKHYRVAVAHSKNICQHIVFNWKTTFRRRYNRPLYFDAKIVVFSRIAFLVLHCGSLTRLANGKQKQHQIACLRFTRLLRAARHMHKICMIVSLWSSLASHTLKRIGRESKLTCYFRIHKSLLVRVNVFFDCSTECIRRRRRRRK